MKNLLIVQSSWLILGSVFAEKMLTESKKSVSLHDGKDLLRWLYRYHDWYGKVPFRSKRALSDKAEANASARLKKTMNKVFIGYLYTYFQVSTFLLKN